MSPASRSSKHNPGERETDTFKGRVKKATSIGLVAGLSLLAGVAYGVQRLIPLWPTQLREDVDKNTTAAAENTKAINELRDAVRANAATVERLSETVSMGSTLQTRDVDQLKERLEWSHQQLTDDVKELKDAVKGMRDDIKILIRETR